MCPVCRSVRVKRSQVFRVAVQGSRGTARPSRLHTDPELAKVREPADRHVERGGSKHPDHNNAEYWQSWTSLLPRDSSGHSLCAVASACGLTEACSLVRAELI